MPVKSHIQIPKSIVKNFSFKDVVKSNDSMTKIDFTYKLSVKNSHIRKIKAKNFCTKKGYYDDDVEEILSCKYEAPFGNIKKEIYQFIKGKKKTMTITPLCFQIAFNFLSSLWNRNKMSLQLYKEESLLKDILPPLTASEYQKICHKIQISPLGFIEDYSMTILIAKGNLDFVTTSCGFTIIPVNKQWLFFLPICPKGGILFYKLAKDGSPDKNTLFSYPNHTLEINKYLYRTEKVLKGEGVISNKRETLELLYNSIYSNNPK